MVTARGHRSSAAAVVVTTAAAVLVALSVLQTAHAKRRHRWKADVIRNHLKNHKSLEGMVRLVDGGSEYEGIVRVSSVSVFYVVI